MLAAVAALVLASGAKKGLQVQMIEDALDLGVRHAAFNVQMGDYLDPRSLAPAPGAVAELKARLQPLRKKGVVFYAILLARQTGDARVDRAILHPRYDPESPNKLAAFNTTAEGEAVLKSFCRAFKGVFDGWIVGNEVNSHHAWFSMGPSTPDEVVDTIERSLRIVHESVEPARVYLSLDHFWTARHQPEPRRWLPGREVLDGVAALARKRGDFPWHVAHHPYPENLFEPRFWLDRTAPLRFSAARVTFRNLEVLTEYLKKPSMTYRGKARRVILSEQGFHRPEGADGETIQAAAYAYAWHRVVRNPGIDAFILHRHVDHAQEGGLRLGLWTNRPGSVADPDRRTRMWEVMKAAGTEKEGEATAFALPIVGLESWEEARPRKVN
ncbi:MAG TPA: DUF5722 domain-containing protein [Fimbriimonas sp.]